MMPSASVPLPAPPASLCPAQSARLPEISESVACAPLRGGEFRRSHTPLPDQDLTDMPTVDLCAMRESSHTARRPRVEIESAIERKPEEPGRAVATRAEGYPPTASRVAASTSDLGGAGIAVRVAGKVPAVGRLYDNKVAEAALCDTAHSQRPGHRGYKGGGLSVLKLDAVLCILRV
jgi:hypothetical protein